MNSTTMPPVSLSTWDSDSSSMILEFILFPGTSVLDFSSPLHLLPTTHSLDGVPFLSLDAPAGLKI